MLYSLSNGSQGNVVGIMTGIEIAQSTVQILIEARDFVFSKMSRLVLRPIKPPIRQLLIFSWGRVAWHEVFHSSPADAKVKNIWSCMSAPVGHVQQKRLLSYLFYTICSCKQFLTLRRLMSYIYGAPILDVSRSHTTTQHSR